jgi:lipopolysaccharide biosynthesis regulator YciM
MRVRTFLGILLAVVAAIAVSYISNLNAESLADRFAVTPEFSISLGWALILCFLVGFLPTVTVLLVQTLRRDLASRRARRLEREGKSLDHSFRRAVDFLSDGLRGKAAAELEAVLAARPEDFSTLLGYGEVLRSQGRAEEALEIHRRASVLYPRSVAVLYQLAEDYSARGESEVAEQVLERILRDFSGQGLLALRRKRNHLLSQMDWREAVRVQERIGALIAEAGDVSEVEKEVVVRIGLAYQRAVSALSDNRTDEASRLLDEILAEEPRFVPALILQGEVELERDGAETSVAAVARWRRGFEVTGSPVFLLRIEDHFIERQQPLEAISTLHALRDVGESDLLPRFFLGRLYYRLEMHDEAYKALKTLSEDLDASPSYHYLMGKVRQRRGEGDLAMRSYLACAERAGATGAQFVCRACDTRTPDWRDRCEKCGSWNSVELSLADEAVSAAELGLNLPPAQAIYDREPQPKES